MDTFLNFTFTGFLLTFLVLIMLVSAVCSLLAFMSIVFIIQGITRHLKFEPVDFIYIALFWIGSIPFFYLIGYTLQW